MTSKSISDHECCYVHSNKRVSWSAIFVGALIALGFGFLLNIFGVALVLSTVKSATNGGIWTIVGMVVLILGVLISMYFSGFASGYLGRLYCPEGNLGIIYGFTTWSTALLLGAVLIGLFSQYVATYTNAVSSTVIVAAAAPVNQIKTPVGTTSISPPAKKGDKPVVEINVVPTNLASSAYIFFVLFFLGAVFTCLGAKRGMHCKRDD